MAGDEGDNEFAGPAELAAGELSAPSQLPQRHPGGVADHVTGPGPQQRQFGDQGRDGVPGEPGPQVIRPGHDQGPGLVDGLGPLRAGAALGDHQHADRLDGTIAAFRGAAGPSGLRGPGGADSVKRVRLALPAAVLPVGAVYFHHPDPSRGDVAGQAGAVAAGAFDPGQADSPEGAQPAQQPRISGRRGGELLHAEQPADGIQRGRDMGISVGVHAASNGACLYDGHCHPFLRLRDGTHPLAVGPVTPRPLAQARQIRPAAPVGA